jgi:hypothetical protein
MVHIELLLVEEIHSLWTSHEKESTVLQLEISVQHSNIKGGDKILFKGNVSFLYFSDFYSCLDKSIYLENTKNKLIECVYNIGDQNFISYSFNNVKSSHFSKQYIKTWCIESPLRPDYTVTIDLVEYTSLGSTDMITSVVRKHVWLIEKWSFVYKTGIIYNLVKFAKGTTKENACINDVQYHVNFNIQSKEYIHKILHKCVDLFKGYTISTDNRKDIFNSLILK